MLLLILPDIKFDWLQSKKEGLFERRGLINKDDGISSPERTRIQSEKAQLQEVGDHAVEDQKLRNFQLVNKSSGISPHEVLQWRLINTVYHLWVTNNKGEGA